MSGLSFEHDLSDYRPRSWQYVKRDVDLVLLRVALLGAVGLRPVESVVLECALQVGQGLIEFFLGVKLPELQAARRDELIGRRAGGNAVGDNLADKVIGHRQKTQPDAGGGSFDIRLDIGKASGGEQGLHGIVQGLASQGVSKL